MVNAKKPNFLIIIADDLGFSDAGAYGSEIKTPNLDRLAREGLRMTGFHTASACSPTRSMVLSGTDNHLAGLGQMAETIRGFDFLKDQPGYEGVLNERVAALPEILQGLPNSPLQDKSGRPRRGAYRTLFSGKWHLGLTKETSPWARGYEESWVLLPGAGNHYAYDPVNADGEPYIKFLPPLYAENDKLLTSEELPKPFYSSDVFTDKLLEQLKRGEGDDRPFFASLNYTAPHWPLQCSKEARELYKGVYDDGPDALRQRRLDALFKLGLIPESTYKRPHPPTYPAGSSEWDTLSPDEKKYSSKLMEIYAGMVTEMDRNIGRIINYLEETGQLDNTYISFMSDNGAEGALLEAIPILGDNIMEAIRECYDNSYENLGEPNSFTWYGERWATAATAPARMFKAWISEGGIRCPNIVRYPGFAAEHQNGAVSHAFTTCMDIAPTVLELAGIPHPGKHFHGREVLPHRGKSWVPYLTNKSKVVHDESAVHGWELFGQQAIRQGPWKAIFIPAPRGKGRWELYNVEEDGGETEDLYLKEQEKLREMVDHWTTYCSETGVIVLAEHPQFSIARLKGYGFEERTGASAKV